MGRIVGAFVIVAAVFLWRQCRDISNDDWNRKTVPQADSVTTHVTPRSHSSSPPSPPSVPPEYRRNPLRFLSTAPVDSLQLLPGIGPVLAERLASARTGKRSFTRWEDVLDVEGIGPKKLQKLKELADEKRTLSAPDG
jgi:predicted flap endonuclease-1-like 5' DNA nuclease